MTAYYNEIDPGAAAWLRELIKAGVIADGYVDERDIGDVRPSELGGYTQCHFFAGIGGWPEALRLAGWPDQCPVWTGSCPCQPFSAAGRRAGFTDERHLWPMWHWLVDAQRPPVIFGEQVASKAGLAWLDLVQADLEGSLYAVEYADLCAAGVGSPQIRQRVYFVAHAAGGRPAGIGRPRQTGTAEHSAIIELADDSSSRLEVSREEGSAQRSMRDFPHEPQSASAARFWSDCEWIACRDGKARPVEPGSFPLAHGVQGRVGLLRGYGNAIVPQVAAAFIEAYMSINS